MIKPQIIKKFNLISRAFFISFVLNNLIFSNATADVNLDAEIEVGVWQPGSEFSVLATFFGQDIEVMEEGEEDRSVYANATLEHAISYLPNFKVAVSEVEAPRYKYVKVDYTGYYDVLDNDHISIDLGAGMSKFNGDELISSVFTEAKPHLYLGADVTLPIPNTSVYTDIHYLQFDGEELNDSTAGIKYDIALEAATIGLKAGYRIQSFKKDGADLIVEGETVPGDIDVKNDGYFLGIEAEF